ncbi:tRNA (guanine37-N1)-methyltransferase [Nematocida sp. AWRm80]|nr:tRNA (guanine37-N1)-methyltransferase [Nematocida sp. AWRm80]
MNYNRIERGEYQESIPCRALKIEPAEINKYLEREDTLNIKRVPKIIKDNAFNQHTNRVFYLKWITNTDTNITVNNPSKSNGDNTKENNADKNTYVLLSSGEYNCNLILTYKYFTAAELFDRANIPETECQCSYNKVGHIIHLNLNEATLQHKRLISRVLFDKITDCKTVVRKVSNINNKYRNIELEHLQGDKNYKTVHRENNLRFSIDYDKVYWNSKLQVERVRLGNDISPNDTVCDLFCGVGPFSIYALSKGALVWANDLNPQSIANLKESLILNRKVLGVSSQSKQWNDQLEDRIHLYNLDAEEFLIQSFKEYNQNRTHPKRFNHYILNLPEQTLKYLKYISRLEQSTTDTTPSLVHAYFFVREGESPYELVKEAMQREIDSPVIRCARKVSPSKDMWLVKFFLLSMPSIR